MKLQSMAFGKAAAVSVMLFSALNAVIQIIQTLFFPPAGMEGMTFSFELALIGAILISVLINGLCAYIAGVVFARLYNSFDTNSGSMQQRM